MLNTAGHNTCFAFAGIPSAGSLAVDVALLIVADVTEETVVVCTLTVFAIIFLSFREKSLWQADLKKGAKT